MRENGGEREATRQYAATGNGTSPVVRSETWRFSSRLWRPEARCFAVDFHETFGRHAGARRAVLGKERSCSSFAWASHEFTTHNSPVPPSSAAPFDFTLSNKSICPIRRSSSIISLLHPCLLHSTTFAGCKRRRLITTSAPAPGPGTREGGMRRLLLGADPPGPRHPHLPSVSSYAA